MSLQFSSARISLQRLYPWLATKFNVGNKAMWLLLLIYPGFDVPNVSYIKTQKILQRLRVQKNTWIKEYAMLEILEEAHTEPPDFLMDDK